MCSMLGGVTVGDLGFCKYSYSSDCQALLYLSVGLSMTLVVSLVTSKNGHNSEMVSSTLRSLTYSTQ